MSGQTQAFTLNDRKSLSQTIAFRWLLTRLWTNSTMHPIHFPPNLPLMVVPLACSIVRLPTSPKFQKLIPMGYPWLKQSFMGVKSTCSTEILLSKDKMKLFAHITHQYPFIFTSFVKNSTISMGQNISNKQSHAKTSPPGCCLWQIKLHYTLRIFPYQATLHSYIP